MRTRLTDTPEDYKKLGVKKGEVEVWEDGRRNDSSPGAFEWWYLDCMFDDGTKACFTYADKTADTFNEPISHPYVKVVVTLPDGTDVTDTIKYTADDLFYGEGKCDVHIGPHTFIGDLQDYHIHYEAVNGVGFDLDMKNLGKAWRPGAGYFMLGDNDEKFFTWLCVCPKAEIEGTMTLNGETRHVSGSAYHDHQWGTQHMLFTWNHWIWARQKVGEYSMLVFDFTANANYGYDRYHLAFIQDGEGNTIFENFGDAKVEILESYEDPKLNKICPGKVRFTYENEGKKVIYTIEEKAQLEIRDEYTPMPDQMKAVFDSMLLQPSYSRLEGEGELTIIDGEKTITEKGSLIYELAYLAKEWKTD